MVDTLGISVVLHSFVWVSVVALALITSVATENRLGFVASAVAFIVCL